jgi:hypothetical protein
MVLTVGAFAIGFSIAVANFSFADAQICPYLSGPPSATCVPNPSRHSIPPAYGGTMMQASGCINVLPEALASLYSYDDASCRQPDSSIGSDLKFMGDVKDKLLYFGHKRGDQSHLEGGLFCDLRHNIVLVAFRGSVGLENVGEKGWRQDWMETNVVATILGQLPLQYEYAYDAADHVKEIWAEHRFDGLCGPKPELLLTGHSKGGAEAQLSAVGLELRAVVFNSNLLTPSLFTDIPSPVTNQSSDEAINCTPTMESQVSQYYGGGYIRDVRMTNDELLNWLHSHYGCRFAHANMEWLTDTTTCRDAGGRSIPGHDMTTVLRELRACAVSNSARGTSP